MKKGFTLTEVMAVVIILSIISLLAFPQILKLIKEGESSLDDATKNLIYTSTAQYINEHNNEFPKVVDSNYCVDLNDLLKEKYIDNSVANKTNFSYVKVTVDDEYKYNYELVNECLTTE